MCLLLVVLVSFNVNPCYYLKYMDTDNVPLKHLKHVCTEAIYEKDYILSRLVGVNAKYSKSLTQTNYCMTIEVCGADLREDLATHLEQFHYVK